MCRDVRQSTPKTYIGSLSMVKMLSHALKRRQSYCFAAQHCRRDELDGAMLDFCAWYSVCICHSSVELQKHDDTFLQQIILLHHDLTCLCCFPAEGRPPGEDAHLYKPAGLSRLFLGVPEQAESQQLQQRQPLSGHGVRRPQRRMPR